MIQENLKNLKQENFYFIKDYLEEVVKIVRMLSLTYNYKKSEAEKRMKEIFLTGLHNECQIEITKSNLFEVEDIMTYISNIEEILMSSVKQTKEYYNKSSGNTNHKPLKYCSFHKSSFHSTDECRKYKESQNIRQQKKYDHKYSEVKKDDL